VDWNAWNRCATKGSSETVAAAFDGNDDLGAESLDKAEDGWYCGRVCCADGEVNGGVSPPAMVTRSTGSRVSMLKTVNWK
jgi:hypothetical protein